MIYFCVKFQKDPQFGVNLTFFAPWLHAKKMKNTKMIIAEIDES
jgi:hypothetical protein